MFSKLSMIIYNKNNLPVRKTNKTLLKKTPEIQPAKKKIPFQNLFHQILSYT